MDVNIKTDGGQLNTDEGPYERLWTSTEVLMDVRLIADG